MHIVWGHSPKIIQNHSKPTPRASKDRTVMISGSVWRRRSLGCFGGNQQVGEQKQENVQKYTNYTKYG